MDAVETIAPEDLGQQVKSSLFIDYCIFHSAWKCVIYAVNKGTQEKEDHITQINK